MKSTPRASLPCDAPSAACVPANESGVHPAYRRMDIVDYVSGPGVAKAKTYTEDELERLAAKREAIEFLDLCGLVSDDGRPKVREIARIVGRSEAEIRWILDERRLDREPPLSFYTRVYRRLGPRAITAWQSVHAAWIRPDLIAKTCTG